MNHIQTFKKLDYVSMLLQTTTRIPRLLFAVGFDKRMEANFGYGSNDVLLVHDLRMMYRKAIIISFIQSD